MDIIFATTNTNKVSRIKNFMGSDELEVHTLDEYGSDFTDADESQSSPILIAENKAQHYFMQIDNNLPVLAQDDTIMIYPSGEAQEILSIKQPVTDKYGEFNDDNAIKYYTELAAQNGGELKLEFHYGFALATEEGTSSEPAILSGVLASDISDTIQPGYFLTAIFKTESPSGEMKFMSEMDDAENAYADRDLKRAITKLLGLSQ